jgi:competence protein ComEA
MTRDGRALAAGGSLVLGLLWAAGRPAPAPAADCPEAREIEARGGHSAAVACRPGPGAGPLRGPALLLFGRPLDPNRADAAALAALPGIGPARAEAIVRERELRPFRRARELDRVPGLGPRTLERLAGKLAVDEER